MQTPIPEYIETRIRRPPPPNSSVVPGSTPVLSFGDAQRATVATLGLNPSRVEFLDQHGNELTVNARRLATHNSLGTSDLVAAPIEIVSKVLEGCNGYFHRNPYRRWFDQLHPVLTACAASYYDGSACHLDLVQWATDPTWGKLKPTDWEQHVRCRHFQQPADRHRGRCLLPSPASPSKKLTSLNFLLRFLPGAVCGAKKHPAAGCLSAVLWWARHPRVGGLNKKAQRKMKCAV
jgi:hypothetical protein